ncbi:MAG: tripartite tricarboxylate transporter substrate binding protein [Betaproteobacteria bacterium]|nr:tripartite tricarboxylate transporter substrate binding protein [Betaproteobacteria bacterium]
MRLLLSLFIFAAFWPSAHSLAQGYPSRLVRVIQPLGVGSPGDLVSRAIAQSLSQTLGQPVVVENRVGANGIIGMEGCAKAAPDGYTICVPSFSQVTMNPVIYSKLPYDPLRDLAPVINIGVINSSIVVNASVPVNTLRELFALAKTKPGALNWGSWGVGSFPHLYLAWMQHSTGTSFTHVPYKTIALAVGAVVAGAEGHRPAAECGNCGAPRRPQIRRAGSCPDVGRSHRRFAGGVRCVSEEGPRNRREGREIGTTQDGVNARHAAGRRRRGRSRDIARCPRPRSRPGARLPHELGLCPPGENSIKVEVSQLIGPI